MHLYEVHCSTLHMPNNYYGNILCAYIMATIQQRVHVIELHSNTTVDGIAATVVLCSTRWFHRCLYSKLLTLVCGHSPEMICSLCVGCDCRIQFVHMPTDLDSIASQSYVIVVVLVDTPRATPTIPIMLSIFFVVHACGYMTRREWSVWWQFLPF